MVWLLVFYWFFSSMFMFGVASADDYTTFDYVKDFVVSLLLGFIFFPMFLGRKIYEKLV